MNGQTTMGLAAAAAAAVRPCRRRLFSSASAALPKASAIPLFPRCSHPQHQHHSRRLPFLVSAASHTSQSDPSTTPTPVTSDPRSAVAGNLPFFDRVLFPGSFPVETPPVEEPAPPADEVQTSASPSREESETEREAWRLLRRAVVSYCGDPVGTVAAEDPECTEMLNYDQVFIRDFVPSALAFLMRGETEIVRNFLLHTLQLQVHGSHIHGEVESRSSPYRLRRQQRRRMALPTRRCSHCEVPCRHLTATVRFEVAPCGRQWHRRFYSMVWQEAR